MSQYLEINIDMTQVKIPRIATVGEVNVPVNEFHAFRWLEAPSLLILLFLLLLFLTFLPQLEAPSLTPQEADTLRLLVSAGDELYWPQICIGD